MSKIYLAAPFFNSEQLQLVLTLESIIQSREDYELFSPRLGANAIEMNNLIQYKKGRAAAIKEQVARGVVTEAAYDELDLIGEPTEELRMKVFNDNWMNIDDADLVLAVIDDFDVGVMWEVGYAFARHVPIVTYTARNFGCNLMLAHSIVGHLKNPEELEDVLEIASPSIGLDSKLNDYGAVIAEIQQKYKTLASLKEGPNERD